MRARLGLLLVAWVGAAGRATGADTWVEVKTANFTVVSNAGEGTAQKTIAEFEQVRAAFGKVWPRAKLAQERPAVVLAFKNEDTFRRWAPGYYETKGVNWVCGSAQGADREYLLVRTDSRPVDASVTPNYNLYRAYLLVLLSSSVERRLPLWLSSGLSDVLANVSVRDKEILVGRAVPWELQYFAEHARLPLRTILDARSESPLVRKGDERHLFDAQSYVLVHYLLFGDHRAHSAKLGRFQQLWLAGRTQDQALDEAFGDLKAIEQALPGYVTRPILSYARFEAEAQIAGDRPAGRVVAPAEVAGLQAAIHVAMDRPVEAQAAIREARTADARSPLSYDAEGLLADRDHDKPRAAQAYAQAVELGSTSVYSHYRAAQIAWKPDADAAALAAIRQRLERAIQLNEFYAYAHSFLADVTVQLGDGQAALASAQRAVALEPGVSYHRVALGRALQKLGRIDEARRSAERGLQLAENDEDRSNAERFLLYLNESSRYAQEREQHETSQREAACQNGDNAACTRILPGLERSCGEGEVRACLYLGWLYGGHGGVARDAAKAAGYGEKACAAGDKNACVEQAWALARGEGLPKDEPKAVAALDALCTDGVFPACTRLGLIHAAKPTRTARARAKALFTRACEGGEQDACSMAEQMK
jgi:TPR repeat protein